MLGRIIGVQAEGEEEEVFSGTEAFLQEFRAKLGRMPKPGAGTPPDVLLEWALRETGMTESQLGRQFMEQLIQVGSLLGASKTVPSRCMAASAAFGYKSDMTLIIEPPPPAVPPIKDYHPSDEIGKIHSECSAALTHLEALSKSAEPYELYFVARIYYEVFNRPRIAILLLWRAFASAAPGYYVTSESIRNYINEIYRGTRGVSLDEIEKRINERVDPAHHNLLGGIRPEADLLILEHGDFSWEYDPGYYDADWDGQGPNDTPPNLRVRPPATSHP